MDDASAILDDLVRTLGFMALPAVVHTPGYAFTSGEDAASMSRPGGLELVLTGATLLDARHDDCPPIFAW